MMETEVTMFDQIMEKNNSLIAEVWEYKEQNDSRLQRHEEALKEWDLRHNRDTLIEQLEKHNRELIES